MIRTSYRPPTYVHRNKEKQTRTAYLHTRRSHVLVFFPAFSWDFCCLSLSLIVYHHGTISGSPLLQGTPFRDFRDSEHVLI